MTEADLCEAHVIVMPTVFQALDTKTVQLSIVVSYSLCPANGHLLCSVQSLVSLSVLSSQWPFNLCLDGGQFVCCVQLVVTEFVCGVQSVVSLSVVSSQWSVCLWCPVSGQFVCGVQSVVSFSVCGIQSVVSL